MTTTGRRPDHSMTLLSEMLERPLDPGYAAAADKRRTRGLPGPTGTTSVAMLLTTLLIGLLLAVSANTLRVRSTATSDARTEIIGTIESRRATGQEFADRIVALQGDVAAAQASVLAAQGGSAARSGQDLTALIGGLAVRGPGIVITMDDATRPDADGLPGQERPQSDLDTSRVLSRDVQIVTNALWEAGAEAVAINGHRLTSRSSIRFAGDALTVNYQSLNRPYTIAGIGDPVAMPTAFAEGDGAAYLAALRDNYGIQVQATEVDEVELPAATALSTRIAQPWRPPGAVPINPEENAP